MLKGKNNSQIIMYLKLLQEIDRCWVNNNNQNTMI